MKLNEQEEESKCDTGQPQEFDVREQLLNWQNKHHDGLNSILAHIENEVPRDFVAAIERAEQKVEEMAGFEREILAQVEEAEEKVRAIVQKIQVNIYQGQSKQGILKQEMRTYSDCVKVDLDRMRELLEIDSQAWRTELDLI